MGIYLWALWFAGITKRVVAEEALTPLPIIKVKAKLIARIARKNFNFLNEKLSI